MRLHHNGLKQGEIRRALGLSERLIREYITLYQGVDPDDERLQLLLADPNAATDETATKKRGGLLS